MAMQAGLGVSRILLIFGAGYTGTILVKNGKLSDLIGDLQELLKNGDGKNTDSDPIAAQLRRLAQEMKQFHSSRQITVLHSGSGEYGITSLIIPVTALGALGYGYMWLKGISFSDLMYVTKKNMATAVADLTKNLENVGDALAKAKKHLTQRIQNLDGKVDDVKEMTKSIKHDVSDARADLSRIGGDLHELSHTVLGLDGRICSLEDKQNLILGGVDYLVQFVERQTSLPYNQFLQSQERVKPQIQLHPKETPLLQGLKELSAFMLTDGNDVNDVSKKSASIKPATAVC